MLILREMLIGKDQDRVLRERVFDRLQVRGVDWSSQVDVADFGSKAWRDRINGDGHDHTLGVRTSPVLQELNHGGPTLAIDSEEIFKPERPGASISPCARSAQRAGVALLHQSVSPFEPRQPPKSGECIWLFRRPATRAGPGGNAT